MKKHIATIITGGLGSVLGAAIIAIGVALSPLSSEWITRMVEAWWFPWVVGASAGMLAGFWIDRLTAAAERKMPPITKRQKAVAIASEIDMLGSNLRRRLRAARQEDYPRSISEARAMFGRLRFASLKEPCFARLMEDDVTVHAYAAFFDQIAPALRAGDIPLARTISDEFRDRLCEALREAESGA
ncbi:hypothetical protein CDV50_10390 [Haematobacter massiliensis]|uniref:hypothetical protein n=1 Tax=Haematobacter massiliensis TaxID=195105 RepID=UPI000B49B15B|nr:hypothetical protein [Haematobacter massiliensis]OWJ71404.1 hypothetical protein CDV50_10390 [Haematobacter massiliensis]